MKRFAIDLPHGEAFNGADAGQQHLLR